MTDISDAADLIATAREALLNQIVPALEGGQRYTAFMIANAMAIAAREHKLHVDAVRSEVSRTRKLLLAIGRPATDTKGEAEADVLTLTRRALAHAIRDGAFDAPDRAAVLTAELLHIAGDLVAISNPKALRA